MRTNIVLDDELVEEAQRLTGLRTKRAVVHEALKTLVRVRTRRNLMDLRGKISFADDYDHKKLRREQQ